MKNGMSFMTWVVGLALVFAATAGTAMAIDPIAPEIDPAAASSAIALLAGGMLLVAERFRRK